MVFNVTDNTAPMRICERLVEAERAAKIPLHEGYGKPAAGLRLDEVAAVVPERHETDHPQV